MVTAAIITGVLYALSMFLKAGNKFFWSKKNAWAQNKDEPARKKIIREYTRQGLGNWITQELTTGINKVKTDEERLKYFNNVLVLLKDDRAACIIVHNAMVTQGLFSDTNIFTSNHDDPDKFFQQFPYALTELKKERDTLLYTIENAIKETQAKIDAPVIAKRNRNIAIVLILGSILIYTVSKI
jgi:hypothetical protein